MGATHTLHENDLLQLRADEFTQRYKVVSKLGSGAFADVLRVKDLSGGREFAVKVLRPAAAHPAGLQPEVALFREARALKHAKHPNVVGLTSVLRVPALGSSGLLKRSSSLKGLTGAGSGSQHGSYWGLLLEYVQGGSLAQVIYKQMVNPYPRAYSDIAALTWAVDLAAAVAHLHALSPCIIHRDLKLENILMQKPEVDDAAPATRKLPIAKISDFGLHVMLETPPCPYLVTTDDAGCPVLLFGPELQQLQQQQQEADQSLVMPRTCAESGSTAASSAAGSAASGSFMAEVAGSAGDSCSEPQLMLLQGPCSSRCTSCNSSSSEVAASEAATAANAAAREVDSAVRKLAAGAAVRSAKHVAFSACTRSLNGLQNQQQQQRQLSPFEAAARDAAAATDQPGAAPAAHATSQPSLAALSDPLPQLLLPGSATHQQQQHHWQPLTTRALWRMSMDSMKSSSPGCSIPLALQLQGAGSSSRPGSTAGSAAFARVAVPSSVLQRPSPSVAAAQGGGSVDDDSGAVGDMAVRTQSGGGAGCYDSVSDILAAANMERDYEVSMSEAPDRATSISSWSRAPSVASSMHAGSSSRPTTPRLSIAAAAAAAGGGPVALADVGSLGGRSWDGVPATTAASMLWEDMMEDDNCQELLDGPGHPGCTSGPLAYDLTQHTGSYMYMAAEIYRGEPYNESVDVFSLGVILYELFSRSLLLYTHTPANTPADSEAYAARVSRGFRPSQPTTFHAGVWRVVERCWAADPTARPAAAWVLQQLQQLLQAEEEAAANAALLKGSTGVAGVLNRLRRPARRSVNANAAARMEESGPSTVAASSTAAAVAAAASSATATAGAFRTDSSAASASTAAGFGSAVASGGSGKGKAVVVAAVACRPGLHDKDPAAVRDTAGATAGRVAAERVQQKKTAEPACGCVIC